MDIVFIFNCFGYLYFVFGILVCYLVEDLFLLLEFWVDIRFWEILFKRICVVGFIWFFGVFVIKELKYVECEMVVYVI